MTFGQVWDFALVRIGGQPVTVGNLVLALVLAVAGYSVSRFLSRAFARLLRKRAGLDTGVAAAIETVGFYLLFVTFVVTSFSFVNFPLTIFTIVGGAAAIGIGFGSQNIMNNFISGLILHLERPIRAGDLVEMEPTTGTVERIGARSTRIRASDNTHIIVPNSFFLENRVTNFTLSDDVIRTKIAIGVVYGSPVREAQRIIREVLNEHPRVLKDPTPRVLFANFGESSLDFDAYFWMNARSIMERREVESDIRFRVDELFRNAGIVIAFPQRDVHLDTTTPLEVRVLGGTRDGVP